MAKTIIAVISDTHAGGSTALTTPKFITDEGQEITANKAQEWLFEKWGEFWQAVKERAGVRGKHRKARLFVIHCGDVVDGLHHRTPQGLPNLSDQEALACELLRPIAGIANGLYIIRGTEAHAGLAAQSEVRVARELGAAACEWALDLEVDGLLMNFAHHGRAGRRDWTSAAAGIAAEIAIDRALTGQPIPALVFRGHSHVIDDTGAKLAHIRAVSLPAWQLKTAFGWRVAPGRRSDIGGVIVEDGQVDFSMARFMAAPGQTRRITV